MSLVTDPRAVIVCCSSSSTPDENDNFDDLSLSSIGELVQRARKGDRRRLVHQSWSDPRWQHTSRLHKARLLRGAHRDVLIACSDSDGFTYEDGRSSVKWGTDRDPGLSWRAEARRTTRRKPDMVARQRLTQRNTSSQAKVQEKYTVRRAREKEEADHHCHKRVSPTATKAGARLYLQAKAQQRQQAQLREEAVSRKDNEALAVCFFKPKITEYAHQLTEHGYQPPQERCLREYAKRQERQQHRHLEQSAGEMKLCPFRPTLSCGSERIVQAQRSRHGSCMGSSPASREPFGDVGERLYLDGGERLLRHQVRQRMKEKREDSYCVGGNVKLSKEMAHQLSARLEAWKRAKDRDIELTRKETEQQQVRNAHRSHPSDCSSKFKRPASASRRGSRAEAMPSSAADDVSEMSMSTKSEGIVCEHECLRRTVGTPSAGNICPMNNHTRLIRLGALFYKYAAYSGMDTVCLREVKEHVRRLYPEDSDLVAVLASTFRDVDEPISKEAFIAALDRYDVSSGELTHTGVTTENPATIAVKPMPIPPVPSWHVSDQMVPCKSVDDARHSRKGWRPRSTATNSARPHNKRQKPTTSASVTTMQRRDQELSKEVYPFKPTINRNSIRLSKIEYERRCSHSRERELQVRQKELTKLLGDRSATMPASSDASQNAQTKDTSPCSERTTLPVAEGRSPSVELSSMSPVTIDDSSTSPSWSPKAYGTTSPVEVGVARTLTDQLGSLEEPATRNATNKGLGNALAPPPVTSGNRVGHLDVNSTEAASLPWKGDNAQQRSPSKSGFLGAPPNMVTLGWSQTKCRRYGRDRKATSS